MNGNVALSQQEMAVASFVGAMRHLKNLHRPGSPGLLGDGWGSDIEGAAAEMAYAKWSDTYWLPLRAKPQGQIVGRPADVDDAEVRATARPDGGLILHPGDPEAVFVLLTGRAPTFCVRGWIHSTDGRDRRWWRDDIPLPAFIVPQVALRPMIEMVAA